jgi:aminoglycoside/choline kinase family phosphotransferase
MPITKTIISALPDFDFKGASSEPLVHRGSDRKYSRLTLGNGKTAILMEYTDKRPDSLKFSAATATLTKLKIPVPKILAENAKKKLIVLQDLGDTHLWDHHDATWKKRSTLYKAAIDAIAKLHAVGADDLSKEQLEALEPEFDEALYGAEQDYFFEHFLSRFSRRAPSYVRSLRHEPVFAELATFLAELPRTLVHRDLQSQNILIVRNKPVFIDYQGLRLGRPEYDLASLLYDPYVDFTNTERNELLKYAFKGRKEDEWRPIFIRCAAQRLMQALGAYGKLGEDDGKEEYLGYIPTALNSLRDVLDSAPILPRLNPYLGEEALKLETNPPAPE